MKRVVKLVISLLVRAGDIFLNGCLRLVGREPRGTFVILYYHGIPAARRQKFARQMDDLVRLAKPVAADHSLPLAAGVQHCAVTFDDGFVSVIENALPELETRRIPSTIFVPSGSLGGPPKWIKSPSHPAGREVVMTAAQLAGFRESSSVIIGSHSVSHPDFLALDSAQADRELTESKATLEAALGKEILLFSFPHGQCNLPLLAKVRAAGYRRAFTIDPELVTSTNSPFVFGRVLADPTDWAIEFRLKVRGAYRWMVKCRHQEGS